MPEIVFFGKAPRPDHSQLLPSDQMGVERNCAMICILPESQKRPSTPGYLPTFSYRLRHPRTFQNDVGPAMPRSSVQNKACPFPSIWKLEDVDMNVPDANFPRQIETLRRTADNDHSRSAGKMRVHRGRD